MALLAISGDAASRFEEAALGAARLLDAGAKRLRKARFGRSSPRPESFDIVLNADHIDTAQIAEILRAACATRCLSEQGFLSAASEAQIQFQTRLELARHSIVPAAR